MNFSILIILIACAFGLYGVKYLNELYQNGTLQEKFEKATKKALHLTLKGIAALGLAWLSLYMFPAVRLLGFTFFSPKLIEAIRGLMEVLFDTRSVYMAIQIIASLMLVAVEISLIFSILGLVVTQRLVIPHVVECNRMEELPEAERCTEVAIPRTFRKIFLNFAHLRI